MNTKAARDKISEALSSEMSLISFEVEIIKITEAVLDLLKNKEITKKKALDKYADYLVLQIIKEKESGTAHFLKEENDSLRKEGVNVVLKTTEEALLDYKITAEEVEKAAERINKRIGSSSKKNGQK